MVFSIDCMKQFINRKNISASLNDEQFTRFDVTSVDRVNTESCSDISFIELDKSDLICNE